jgi:hypothetical protein
VGFEGFKDGNHLLMGQKSHRTPWNGAEHETPNIIGPRHPTPAPWHLTGRREPSPPGFQCACGVFRCRAGDNAI